MKISERVIDLENLESFLNQLSYEDKTNPVSTVVDVSEDSMQSTLNALET